MDVLILLLLCCMAAPLPIYSHTHHLLQEHHLYHNIMPAPLSSLQPPSHYHQSIHEKTDVDALLSFRKAITSDPLGKLSDWTPHNSHNICSWFGVSCRLHTKRVVAIDLHANAIMKSEIGETFILGFKGSLEGTLSSSICNLSLLGNLNLSDNSLAGRIPPDFGRLKALRVLDLSFNFYINGSIPVELGQLKKLRTLKLGLNELMGRIPAQLGQLKALQTLDLSWNELNGSIPAELGQLKKLRTLMLSENSLSGRIPAELGELKALETLDLRRNVLSGSIPVELGLLQKLEYLILDGNDFSGNIPRQLGEIPLSIGSMSSLRLLNLSGNQLEGKIPACLSEISTLEELDLAKNKLYGSIPQELSKLSMLASLDVSSNNLCGSIPTGTQFSTFNETSFERNKCLCGFPLRPCKQNDNAKKATAIDSGGSSDVKKGWLNSVNEKLSLMALALGMGIGFGGVVAMFIAWDRARCWVMGLSPNNKRSFYGLYRFPT